MAESPRDTATVLVIEDERDLADLYGVWLAEDYDVEIAYTGQDGLNTIGAHIDLVVLDRRLPDIAGDDVLNKINQEWPELPVAIVSAITPGFGVIDMGIEDYVVKPVEKTELQTLVAEMLERTTHPEPRQELERLRSKKAALEAVMSSNELVRSTEYQRLERRITEIQSTNQ